MVEEIKTVSSRRYLLASQFLRISFSFRWELLCPLHSRDEPNFYHHDIQQDGNQTSVNEESRIFN